MFYVYDPDGLKFQGPMEAFEKQRRVVRRSAIPPLKEGGREAPFGEGAAAHAANTYKQQTSKQQMVEPLVHIYQIMTTDVTTIGADVPLIDAWTLLHSAGIRQLVVISERRQIRGMLSDREILRRINVTGDRVEMDYSLLVRDLMKEEVVTTDSMSDIRRVARVMALYHLDALPVTEENGQLIGIVTRGDILRGFAENPKLNLWA